MTYRICLRLALVVLFAALCPAAWAEGAPKDVRSVGVVALLGDEIKVFRFGKWFDGYSYKHELTGAGFDALVEETLEAHLKNLIAGVTVKRIALDRAHVTQQSNRGLLAIYNGDVSDIREAITPWAAAENVDLIVIVRQLNQAVPIQAPRSNFRGLGLYASFDVLVPVPVASVGIIVWDGRTLDHISEGQVFLLGYDNRSYSTENEMRVNLEGPRREKLVADLRQLVRGAVPALLVQVRSDLGGGE